MNTFDKKSWTPQAATRWQNWCAERMRLCKMDAASIAAHAVLAQHKESLASCRNTIDGFLKGDADVLQRLFHPVRKTRYPTEERLQRLLTDFRWGRMDHIFLAGPAAANAARA